MKKCRYSTRQILDILRELDEGSVPSVVELCRKHGISRQTYYDWRTKYGEPRVDAARLRRLEAETATLRALLQAQINAVESLRSALNNTA